MASLEPENDHRREHHACCTNSRQDPRQERRFRKRSGCPCKDPYEGRCNLHRDGADYWGPQDPGVMSPDSTPTLFDLNPLQHKPHKLKGALAARVGRCEELLEESSPHQPPLDKPPGGNSKCLAMLVHLGPIWAEFGPTRADVGQNWPTVGQRWSKLAAGAKQSLPKWSRAQLSSMCSVISHVLPGGASGSLELSSVHPVCSC